MRAFTGISIVVGCTLWCSPLTAGQKMSKENCRRMGPTVEATATSLAQFEAATRNDAPADLLSVSDGAVHEAVVKAIATAKRLADAANEYQIALEELGHQLQICGR